MFIPPSPEERSEWAEKIRQQRNSGLNATSWCRRHQIAHSTFVYWKDCLSSKPLVCRSPSVEPDMAARVSIEYRDIRIHLDKSFDLATLKDYLSALQEM
jgi:hypothetical protein